VFGVAIPEPGSNVLNGYPDPVYVVPEMDTNGADADAVFADKAVTVAVRRLFVPEAYDTKTSVLYTKAVAELA
jgi:hypothetical protein